MASVYIHPNNKILIKRHRGMQIKEFKIETATNMYAGRLVKKGTADEQIVVCGAGAKPDGWLGYEDTHYEWRPAGVDTIYTVNYWAAVYSGGGFVIVASLASGQNVSRGDRVIPASGGQVTAASAMSVTITTGSHSAVDLTTYTVDGSVPTDGYVVGKMGEDKDASGAAADAAVESFL